MSPRPRPVRRRYPLSLHLRSALSRRRRLAAAVLVSLALGLVVLRLGPPRTGTVPVVTAAEALPAGTVLGPEQLAVAAYPPGLVPQGAVADPAELAGRTLAGAAGAGQPLTGAAVVGPGLLTGRPAGATAVTLRIDDPAVLQHVRAGDHVDVVGLSDDLSGGDRSGERRILGRALPVLWVPSPASGADGGLLAASPGEEAGLLVVGAPHEDAARLAGAGPSTVVLVPAPVSPSAEAVGP
ncbi:SAF domain-containing protein [Kocuria turfanensis]|uniref:SAF domain-containing protein n=1 Tax=Kocuria turfanensis TaxID=388357 RepID=UPI0040366411